MHPSRRVQRLAEVALERLELARGPGRGVSLLRAQRQARAHREDFRAEPEQGTGVPGYEPADLLHLELALEDVDLVEDEDNFLAPPADLLEERALRFRERPIRGGHEQDQVGPRHELGGNRLVLPDDRIRAGRIDNVDFPQKRHRCRDDVQGRTSNLTLQGIAVLQNVDLRGCRRYPLLRDGAADERVDERALTGVELADDDEETELVELRYRAFERQLLLRGGIEPRQRYSQPRQNRALLAQELIIRFRQDSRQHLAEICRNH